MPAVPEGDDRPAHGLIVKLKAVRSVPAGLGSAPVSPERLKLNQVLAAAGVAPRSLRAIGHAAQHLDFGRTLGSAEAGRMAQRLRDRPEVEWGLANVRERRLQATPLPDDPLFADPWWLRSVAGSSANAIADRRRGVPGFETA